LLDNILIYHWQAWHGFLISHLVADYCQIEAQYEDDIGTLETQLTPNISAVLFQINLTYSHGFPAQRSAMIHALKQRNIHVLNLNVDDISKRNLHYLLEKAGLRSAKDNQFGANSELLFIKSNLNWGGEVEQRLPGTLNKCQFAYQHALVQGWDKYYSARRADIDPLLWSDHSIVIERLIKNSEQSFFRVYRFGDAIVVVKAHSPALIKKVIHHTDDINYYFTKNQIMNQSCNIPVALQDNIRSFIYHYPLAYFCLDIVHDMQDYFIVDLNLTPYSGVQQQQIEATTFLVKGARQYIKNHQHKVLMRA